MQYLLPEPSGRLCATHNEKRCLGRRGCGRRMRTDGRGGAGALVAEMGAGRRDALAVGEDTDVLPVDLLIAERGPCATRNA